MRKFTIPALMLSLGFSVACASAPTPNAQKQVVAYPAQATQIEVVEVSPAPQHVQAQAQQGQVWGQPQTQNRTQNQTLAQSTQAQNQIQSQAQSQSVDTMPKHEVFMRRFCAQHTVPYGSDECRSVFLKEWAKESIAFGKEGTKEGFQQLDQYMRKGSYKIGEKWGEYSRAFKEGAKDGYRNK